MRSARIRFAGTWRWFTLVWLLAPAPLFAHAVTGVGFYAITIPDPVNGGTMPGYVFYPSAQARGVTCPKR